MPCTVRERIDELGPSDKGALPRAAGPTECLVSVASRTEAVNPDLVRVEALCQRGAVLEIVGRDRSDQRPLRDIGFGDELIIGAHRDEHIDGPEGLALI